MQLANVTHKNNFKLQAEFLADWLRQHYRLAGPPFDPFSLKKCLDVKLRTSTLEMSDGLSYWGPGGYFVEISPVSSRIGGGPRRRYTLAHELGHIVLEMIRTNKLRNAPFDSELSRRYIPGSKLESFCDAFAAEWIMPRVVFNEFALKEKVGFAGIENLARVFCASKLAVIYRIADTDAWPHILLSIRSSSKNFDLQLGIGIKLRSVKDCGALLSQLNKGNLQEIQNLLILTQNQSGYFTGEIPVGTGTYCMILAKFPKTESALLLPEERLY